jgi:N-methylhydantoinase B
LFEQRSILEDSAGAGKFRGGFAQKRKYKILGDDAQFFHTSQKSRISPQGLFGGEPGKSGKWIINEGTPEERIIENAMGDVTFLKYGDTVTCVTPSGGGYGDPYARDPELVRNDVEQQLITIEKAVEDYGVAINPYNCEIDITATKELRNKQKSK